MHTENVIATPIHLRPAQYLSPREQRLLFEALEARTETEIGLMLGFGLSRLVPRRWTHSNEFEGSALGSRSVVVHLIGDIVDDAARPDGNGVVLIELRPRANQESSGQ